VLAVSLDRSFDDVRRFLGRDPPAAVVLATGDPVPGYGVAGLPETYLVDGAGRLRFRFRGPRDWRDPSLRGFLRRIR
jgi:hypothetical protein